MENKTQPDVFFIDTTLKVDTYSYNKNNYNTISMPISILRYHLTANSTTCFTATKQANTTTITSDGNEATIAAPAQ